MILRHKDIVIDENKPFKNCKLEREMYAKVLTDIVTSYADGFVLVINNSWGTGKPHSSKCWKNS